MLKNNFFNAKLKTEFLSFNTFYQMYLQNSNSYDGES